MGEGGTAAQSLECDLPSAIPHPPRNPNAPPGSTSPLRGPPEHITGIIVTDCRLTGCGETAHSDWPVLSARNGRSDEGRQWCHRRRAVKWIL